MLSTSITDGVVTAMAQRDAGSHAERGEQRDHSVRRQTEAGDQVAEQDKLRQEGLVARVADRPAREIADEPEAVVEVERVLPEEVVTTTICRFDRPRPSSLTDSVTTANTLGSL